MHHLEKAKIAITLEYIETLSKQPRAAEPSSIVKNLLAAAAEDLLAVAQDFDDKSSLLHAFFKLVGLQHIQFVAEHGVLPAVDNEAKGVLYYALLAALKSKLEAELKE